MDWHAGGITDVFADEEEKDGARSEVTGIPAFVCRRLDTDNSVVKFVEVTVMGYDEGAGMYVVVSRGGSKPMLRPLVFVIFKTDDPFVFAQFSLSDWL